MSQLVHGSSMLGGALESMPHGGVPPTNIEIVDSFDDLYLPTAQNYGSGQVVTFQVAGSSSYTDLSKSYVRVTGNWESTGATGLSQSAFTVAPGFPDTCLVTLQNMYLNGQKVSPSRGGDPWIQFVNKGLMRREAGYESDNRGVNTTTMVADADFSLYALDDYGKAEGATGSNIVQQYSAGAAALSSGTNRGAQSRYERVLNDIIEGGGNVLTKTSTLDIQYLYRPEMGAWNLNKLLPDRVDLRLELTMADPTFYTISPGFTVVFNITRMELILHHVQLRREVIEQNNVAMLEKPYEIPTMLNIYQKSVIEVGTNTTSKDVDLSSVYQGPLPKMVAVFLQDNNFTSNSVLYNPFAFNEGVQAALSGKGSISNLYIIVNGRQIPRRPYDLPGANYYNRNSKFRQYRDFVQACAAGWGQRNQPMVSYLQYCQNYSVYLFWVDPLQEVHDQYSPTEDCNLEIHGQLRSNQNLAENVAVHTICYVPAVLEVDGARNVKLVTRSGELLAFQ